MQRDDASEAIQHSIITTETNSVQGMSCAAYVSTSFDMLVSKITQTQAMSHCFQGWVQDNGKGEPRL